MRVAAIDVGTNSFHLLIADVMADGRLVMVEKAREQVMLGEGGIGRRTLAPAAFARGLDTLARFKAAADGLECEDIHAGATSAVREASNGQAFCEAVKARTGIHLRVLSGADEARLIYLGARQDLDFTRGRVLLFDVGGGSTEFILADARGPLITLSLPLGHIRLAERFQAGRFDAVARRAMKKHVRAVLTELSARVRPEDIGAIVGTSGTVRTLARIGALARGEALPGHDTGLVLGRRDVERFLDLAQDATPEAFAALPGMDSRRIGTLPAGAVLVREVLKTLSVPELSTSERSLRDGLIVDWVERHRPEIDLQRLAADPRERTVLRAMQRFCPSTTHAHHVADLAVQLFDALGPRHRLPATDRDLLRVAALLHDIGHHIAGKGHHKHGMYLLKHIPMYGFTAPEIAVLANVVRYHSRSTPKASHPDWVALPRDDQRRVKVMAGLLRVADALDRSHDQPVQALAITDTGDAIRLDATLREGGDLERWAFAQRHDLLERTLGAPIQLRIVRPDGADDELEP